MYIPIVVIICMVCGAIGGTLGYYLTKKNKKEKKKKTIKWSPFCQAVDKCKKCMSQQPIVNVNIKMYKSDKIKMYNYSKLTWSFSR